MEVNFNSYANSVGLLKQEDVNNLKHIWNRKKGQLFFVDNNQIKIMNIWQRILYCLFNFYRNEVNTLLFKEINHLTAKINLERADENSKKFVTQLFFEKLSPLSRQIYRRQLPQTVFNHLVKEIKFRENEIPSEATGEYQTAYKMAKVWARLGNFENATGGVSGSYKIIKGKILSDVKEEENSKEEILGIYKPHNEDTLSPTNPKIQQKIKLIFAKTIFSPFTKLTFDCVAGQGFVAEVAAKKLENYVSKAVKEYLRKHSKIASFHDLQFVPDTQIAYLPLGKREERKGSFQLWINTQTAAQFLNTKRHYQCGQAVKESMKDKMSTELFDLMVIIDYISSNFDRHGDNWLIKSNETGKASGIRLIDGGWSMGPKHPRWWSIHELKNQYMWKVLPFADGSFSELGKFVIDYLEKNKSKIAKEILGLYDTHFPYENEKNKKRVEKMLERLQVLQLKKNVSKKDLAKIRTHSQIKKTSDKFSCHACPI